MSVPEYAHRLRDAVAHATPLLLALDADASARPLAAGKWSPRDMQRALEACDRAACGPVAPPQGLYLVRVDYGTRGELAATDVAADEE